MKELSKERGKVCIMSIGRELLQGRVVNTNAAYLARRFSVMGYEVEEIVVVDDSFESISRGLRHLLDDVGCSMIVTTGGLGPTPDDITMEAIARFLGVNYVINEEARRLVEEKVKARGLQMTESRLKMAYMPEGAKVIPNPVGTAPGALIEFKHRGRDVKLIILPGVPREVEAMFESYIEPSLRKRRHLIEAVLRVYAREADLAPILSKIMREAPDVYVKSHVDCGTAESVCVKVYFALYSDSIEDGLRRCSEVVKKFESMSMTNNIKTELEVECRAAK